MPVLTGGIFYEVADHKAVSDELIGQADTNGRNELRRIRAWI